MNLQTLKLTHTGTGNNTGTGTNPNGGGGTVVDPTDLHRLTRPEYNNWGARL
jgi:hypothetical protein